MEEREGKGREEIGERVRKEKIKTVSERGLEKEGKEKTLE